jgi:integrase
VRGSTYKRCACRDGNGKQLGAKCPKLGGKRHGSWYFATSMPKAGGGRKQMKRGGFATKAAAEGALEEVVGKLRRGESIDDKQTVGDWLTLWITEKTKPTGASSAGRKIQPSTARSYRQHINDYLVPELGQIPLAKLTAEDISAAYDAIQDDRPDMGASTLRRVHATLSSALARAVKTRRIGFNPAAHVDLPDAKRPKVNPWQPAELGQFLDHVVSVRLGMIYETIAATGMRRGEALGVRWSDLDLEVGVIVVRQQLLDVAKGQPKFGKPKTDAGEDRIIELDSRTIGALMAHRFAQEAERAEWGDAYDDHDLVFAREDGSPYVPSTITKAFVRFSAVAGVRRIRLHDLRHGAASLMLAAGVPIEIVSKRLGHKSLAITMDTYSHLLDGVGRDAAEKAQALVPRAPREAERSHIVPTVPRVPSHEELAVEENDSDRSEKVGGPRGTRTHNPRIKSPLLCQLS